VKRFVDWYVSASRRRTPRLVRMTSTSPCPTLPIVSISCSNRPSPAVAPVAATRLPFQNSLPAVAELMP
jgi:hypothetical protein